MTAEWLAALEGSQAAGLLRGSVWAYPLINAGHILGIALLIGAIVPLDLRLLGGWRSVPPEPLWRVLRPTAGIGLGLAIFCGILLFITRATAYAESTLFISKMVAVAAGTLNALVLQSVVPADHLPRGIQAFTPTPLVRFAAGLSMAAWLSALFLGRLVGYF